MNGHIRSNYGGNEIAAIIKIKLKLIGKLLTSMPTSIVQIVKGFMKMLLKKLIDLQSMRDQFRCC